MQPKKILIIQTAFLGDVVLTLPLLSAAARLFPSAKIDFLAIPAAANVVQTHPDLHSLVVYDKRGSDRGISGLFSLIKKLRKCRYGLALVPHRSFRSAFLAFAAGIPVRVGFSASAGRRLLTHIVPYERKKSLHEAERNLGLLSLFGEKMPSLPPRVFVDENDRATVDNFLRVRKIFRTDPLIALAPGSVWATKRWLPERYAELASRFTSDGKTVILIGGKDDRELCDKILLMSKKAGHNAAGMLTPRESAELIRRCRLLVTNDSAPLHLANAVKTPVVAIFGPTVSDFGFFPRGVEDRLVEINGLTCRPCGIHGGTKCPIGTFECMKNISVPQVMKAIGEVLGEEISCQS